MPRKKKPSLRQVLNVRTLGKIGTPLLLLGAIIALIWYFNPGTQLQTRVIDFIPSTSVKDIRYSAEQLTPDSVSPNNATYQTAPTTIRAEFFEEGILTDNIAIAYHQTENTTNNPLENNTVTAVRMEYQDRSGENCDITGPTGNLHSFFCIAADPSNPIIALSYTVDFSGANTHIFNMNIDVFTEASPITPIPFTSTDTFSQVGNRIESATWVNAANTEIATIDFDVATGVAEVRAKATFNPHNGTIFHITMERSTDGFTTIEETFGPILLSESASAATSEHLLINQYSNNGLVRFTVDILDANGNMLESQTSGNLEITGTPLETITFTQSQTVTLTSTPLADATGNISLSGGPASVTPNATNISVNVPASRNNLELVFTTVHMFPLTTNERREELTTVTIPTSTTSPINVDIASVTIPPVTEAQNLALEISLRDTLTGQMFDSLMTPPLSFVHAPPTIQSLEPASQIIEQGQTTTIAAEISYSSALTGSISHTLAITLTPTSGAPIVLTPTAIINAPVSGTETVTGNVSGVTAGTYTLSAELSENASNILHQFQSPNPFIVLSPTTSTAPQPPTVTLNAFSTTDFSHIIHPTDLSQTTRLEVSYLVTGDTSAPRHNLLITGNNGTQRDAIIKQQTETVLLPLITTPGNVTYTFSVVSPTGGRDPANNKNITVNYHFLGEMQIGPNAQLNFADYLDFIKDLARLRQNGEQSIGQHQLKMIRAIEAQTQAYNTANSTNLTPEQYLLRIIGRHLRNQNR